MTTDWREVVPCGRCGAPVSTEVPIKAWIRAHKQLDSRQACLCIGDSDLWVQRYGTRRTRTPGVNRDVQYLMQVEIKTHGRDLDIAQRDLLLLVNTLLRTKAWKDQRIDGRFIPGHLQTARIVPSFIAGRLVQVHCYGVHLLQLSGATPEDSDGIQWDRKPISREQLAALLRFDLQPDSLRQMEHRAHKRLNDHPMIPGFSEESA